MSGVEAVYIDENRINSLANGKATVILKGYAGRKKDQRLCGGLCRNRLEVKTLTIPLLQGSLLPRSPLAATQSTAPL